MRHTNGGGSGSWRNEIIVSAERVSRNLNSSGSGSGSGSGGLARHEGVVVHTSIGNNYLIHHPGPQSTVTVTNASNMSKNWSVDHKIQVQGAPTVQQAYNGAGGRTNNPKLNYFTAGTCKGAANGVQLTLEGKGDFCSLI